MAKRHTDDRKMDNKKNKKDRGRQTDSQRGGTSAHIRQKNENIHKIVKQKNRNVAHTHFLPRGFCPMYKQTSFKKMKF